MDNTDISTGNYGEEKALLGKGEVINPSQTRSERASMAKKSFSKQGQELGGKVGVFS